MNTETAAHRVVELGLADFQGAIQHGVTLVDFWAPWCGPCRLQTPVLEQVGRRLAGQVQVAKVNVDEYPELAARFQIAGIPTLLLFKEGCLVHQFVGVQSAPVLLGALKSLVESSLAGKPNPSNP